MTDPSPRPWHIDPRTPRIIENRDGFVTRIFCAWRLFEENEANAALILRCVNCHDDLVAALEAVTNHSWAMQEFSEELVADIRAALLKAKGLPNEP